MIRFAFALLSLLLASGAARAQSDTKALADGLIREIRTRQQADGSYGDPATTCRVLDLLGRSPRHYNELDGPFVRRAAQWLAAQEGVPALDGWRVLALASAITGPLVNARNRARDHLLQQSGSWDLIALLALTTLPPPVMPELPPATDSDSAARQVLLVADPATVTAPSVVDRAGWVAWARAARLRGVRPLSWPSLPSTPPGPTTALDTLLRQLDLVIAVHGLDRHDQAPPDASVPPPPLRPSPPSLDQALADALAFLDARQQDGSFGLDMPGWDGPEPGVTALCLSATIQACQRLSRPRPAWVEQGLDWLGALQHPDGSIQTYGVAVYTTSVAMEALLDGGRKGDREVVAKALAFLVAAQADEGEGYDPDDDRLYGGVGYGGDERPDLSNSQMATEAAVRAGLAKGHPFFSKLLPFLERTQNLGEVSAFQWPRAGGGKLVSGTDGGATYMPGSSPAGEDQIAPGVYVARSYGSMTYALTKSYLLSGLPPSDQRVRAAIHWLVEHFTLETNPGFEHPAEGGAGRYYYYLAMARTLSLLDDAALRRDDGTPLAWRTRLTDYLLGQQRTDGSWINLASPRWYEGAPTLCTPFALLSLSAAAASDP